MTKSCSGRDFEAHLKSPNETRAGTRTTPPAALATVTQTSVILTRILPADSLFRKQSLHFRPLRDREPIGDDRPEQVLVGGERVERHR